MILKIGIGKTDTFNIFINNLKTFKHYEKDFSYFGSCGLWY